eukprot:TRINITY_DN6767_c0_g1_i2.p1 TRINITY_DN6767_c0_g1~~TRINITY_DN6767_c0_g1_i2.p1  ORF type:complete len:233 (+),score=52.77 TRINITY_DN6767_c0_g1_i2:130-828(+)
MIDLYHQVLKECKESRVVDLSSAASGPLRGIHHSLSVKGQRIKFVLTHHLPVGDLLTKIVKDAPDDIDFVAEPVLASNVPKSLNGVRSFFSAFQQFDTQTCRAIIQDAVNASQGIAVFEFTERRIFNLLVAIFIMPIFCLVSAPFQKSFGAAQYVFTFVLPVIPIVMTYDAVVNCLRSYSAEEMWDLVEQVQTTKTPYIWKVGRKPVSPYLPGWNVTYLIGYPNKRTPDTPS